MKINVNNTEKLQAEISKVEKGCSVRKLTISDIESAVNYIENKLANRMFKKDWKGVKFYVNCNAQNFPGAYRGTPESTVFTIERGANDWFVTAIYRDHCTRTFISERNIREYWKALVKFATSDKNW